MRIPPVKAPVDPPGPQVQPSTAIKPEQTPVTPTAESPSPEPPSSLQLDTSQGKAQTSLQLVDDPPGDPKPDLPKSPANELRTAALELPYTVAVAINEAEGDKRFQWEQAGGTGPAPGMETPYYHAQKGDIDKGLYWGLSLGAGPLLSYTASHVGNNLINGDPAFKDINGVEAGRHLLFNVALEDALYWAMMNKPVNDDWMRGVAGEQLGQTLGENSPLGVPFSYNAAAGAMLAGPLAHHRAVQQGKQDIFGLGGSCPTGSALDAAARFSFATGIALSGISAASGQPLPNGLRSAGAIVLTGGMADSFATLQDGIRRDSVPGMLAGSLGLASSYFQMSSFAAYNGVNAQGLPNGIHSRSVSIPAVALGVLSLGARCWDEATK